MTRNTARISRENIDGILAQTAVRRAGYVMPHPHCHPYIELFYVESGTCRFFVENDVYDIHAGDFMLIPPEIYHYTRYPAGACRRSVLRFQQSDVEESILALLPWQAAFFSATRIFQAPEEYRGQIGAQFARMVNEKKISDKCSRAMLRVLLSELFLLCVRECRLLYSIPDAVHTTDRQIVQAARFISAHYRERITAADIAAAAGYSPNYLSKKFKASVGLGLHEYLMFVRLRQAAYELVTTQDRITDIAFRCGFSDSNYFKDAFKKKYGVTPRAYRRQP